MVRSHPQGWGTGVRALIVGGGAREHAIAEALVRSGAELVACAKLRNPGIAALATVYGTFPETEPTRVAAFASEQRAELAVIGPEGPLEAGVADVLLAKGISVVGPTRAAARIETSKAFMRDLLRRHRVPGSIPYAAFQEPDSAAAYLREHPQDQVIKPAGLTGGKGVRVLGEHLSTVEDAVVYVREIFDHRIGGAGGVVVEQRLKGEEITLQALTDGTIVLPMPAVQDHKRAWEGDRGPNTGGMGSYSQADGLLPFLTKEEYRAAVEILQKAMDALRTDGIAYRGVLYGQFMLTVEGPKIVEFNARFGDPEAMNVLPILESDFVELCERTATGRLAGASARFAPQATVCKYVVPEGYGEKPLSGERIDLNRAALAASGARLHYASVTEQEGTLYTTSSRALAFTGIAPTIPEAERIADQGTRAVRGRIFVRHDIGTEALIRTKVEHMERLRAEARQAG